jgi:UTP--glucose-1-phosphate uridylyltransferase
MSRVTKAIIPVGGWGTRRLPITKAIEKCMLPIGNRPIVDYVVQDAINAGITDIYFVVNETSTQLQAYYSRNEVLESYLEAKHKEAELQAIQLPENVTFHYIVQPSGGNYGTAVPVALADQYVEENESVAVLMGDDFIYNSDGASELSRLIQAIPEGSCGLLAASVPHEDVSRYGVIELDKEQNYIQIVEKPLPDQAPSNLINVSKYILTKDVFRRAAEVTPALSGESQITDAINSYVSSGGTMKVVTAEGVYLDGGSLEGWLEANRIVAGS